jgi:hypothetical protein
MTRLDIYEYDQSKTHIARKLYVRKEVEGFLFIFVGFPYFYTPILECGNQSFQSSNNFGPVLIGEIM